MMTKVKVVLTRDTDRFIELNERARMAVRANARLFVSIHMNAFNGQARGIETFLHNNSTASRQFATRMNNELLKQFNVPNRGVKQANFAVLRGTYKHMLSILTETLFMDNAQDAQIFNRSNFTDKAAQAHAAGILAFANDGDVVVLDPGHGGHDNGASGHGHREKDLVLEIALKTRDILEGRSSGGFASLSNAEKFKEMERAVEQQGSTIKELQEMLIKVGEKLPRFGADGKPGLETLTAVEAFQVRAGISDGSGANFGRPGPQTFRALRDKIKKQEEVEKIMSNVFKDISENHSLFNEVKKGKELGIVKGFEDGSFKPDEPLTRAQGAAMNVRVFEEVMRRLDQ